jgi:hypothetical protein
MAKATTIPKQPPSHWTVYGTGGAVCISLSLSLKQVYLFHGDSIHTIRRRQHRSVAGLFSIQHDAVAAGGMV